MVIGAGSIARRHIRNLRSLGPVRHLAAMTSRARSVAPDSLGADAVWTSLDEALAAAPDRVIVASPAPQHLDHARRFAEAGIPVLIEKPLAHDWSSCLAHAGWLERHAALLSVGYNLRYLESARFMKRLIGQGALNGLSSLHIEVGLYLPDWRPGTDYRTQVSSQRALGGGAILELSHEIDLLFWLMGQPQGVFCRARQSGQLHIDVEDTVDSIFVLRDGASATMHMDFLQRARVRQFSFICADSTLRWDLARDSVARQTADEQQTLFTATSEDRNLGYIAELREFFEQGRCAASADEALRVMHAIDAMKRSSERQSFEPLGPTHG